MRYNFQVVDWWWLLTCMTKNPTIRLYWTTDPLVQSKIKVSIPQSQYGVTFFLKFIENSNFRLKFLISSTKSEIIGENNCGEKIVEKLNTDSYTLKHFFFGWGATTLKRKNLLNNTFRTSFKNWGKALTLCDEFWHLWNSFDFANENIKQNVEPDVSKTGATIFKSGGRTSWKGVYFVCR